MDITEYYVPEKHKKNWENKVQISFYSFQSFWDVNQGSMLLYCTFPKKASFDSFHAGEQMQRFSSGEQNILPNVQMSVTGFNISQH